MTSKSAELRAEADWIEGQEALAAAALKRKGKLARFWSAEYKVALYAKDKDGQFVGLACKSCNRWEDAGHDSDCAVAELEGAAKNDR